MRLHRLLLENFRGIERREVEFPDTGVVVVQGANETGKTSMIDAFDYLLRHKDNSRHREIRGAKPVDRDVPVIVEAEFSIGPDRVIYRKQWAKSPSTTLRYVGGPSAGRTVTGGEAHDAAEALQARADQVLWKALRIMQDGTAFDNNPGDSAALRGALDRQAGTVDRDDTRSQALIDRVAEEADRYWTPRRTGPNAAFKAVLAEADAAEEARVRAAAQVEEISGIVDDLARAREEIGRIEATLDERESEERALAGRLVEVDAAQERARQADRDHAEAVRGRDVRAERDRVRGELREEVAAARTRIAELAATHETAEERADAARGRLADAEEALTAASVRLDRARSAREVAEADAELLGDEGRAARIAETLARLDEIRAVIGRHSPVASGPVTAKKLAALEKAERAAEQAEAELRAGSAQLRIAPPDGGGTVKIDGTSHALTEAWQQAVVADTRIEFADGWRIDVTPEQGIEERSASVRRARGRLQKLLAELSVASVAEAHERRDAVVRAEHEVATAEARREGLLGDASEESLRDEHDRILARSDRYRAERPAEPPLPSGPDEAGTRREAARAAYEEARADHETARSAAEAARRTAAETDAALRESRAGLEAHRTDLARRASTLEQDRARADDEALARELAEADGQVDRTAAALSAAQDALVRMDADGLRADHEVATTAVGALRTSREKWALARSGLEGQLKAADRDRRQADLDEALTRAEFAGREKESWQRRADGALLLESTLLAHRTRVREAYQQPFRDRIAELGRAAYGDPDFDVEVDESLRITHRHLAGRRLEVDQLSTGAKEQLAILVRLATAMLVDPEEGVPVMLDDALAHSDRHRLGRLMHALATTGRSGQVVLLTCHPDRYAGLPDAVTVDV